MATNNEKTYYEGYGLKIIQTNPGFYEVYDAKCGGRLKFTFKCVTSKEVNDYIKQTVDIRKKNKIKKGRFLWQES